MKTKRLFAVALAVTTVISSSLVSFAATETAAPAAKPAATTSTVKVGTSEVKSTVSGSYSASITSAVTTPVATIAAAMKLEGNQKPYLIVMDTDQKKSYAAMNSLNGAAKALGVTMGSVINFNLGIRDGVNFKTVDKNNNVKVSYTVAAPKDAAGKTCYVIGVYYGGEIVVYADKDKDPNTITVDLPVGLGTYAVVFK